MEFGPLWLLRYTKRFCPFALAANRNELTRAISNLMDHSVGVRGGLSLEQLEGIGPEFRPGQHGSIAGAGQLTSRVCRPIGMRF